MNCRGCAESANRVTLIDSVVTDLIRALGQHKQQLTDLRDECERHIAAVHERDLIIRDLTRDIETLKGTR